jgi:hypothetical protein
MTDKKSGLKERMSDFGFEIVKPIKTPSGKDDKKKPANRG